jgi:uncharacterized protein YycO
MKKSSLFKTITFLSIAAAGVFAWLKFLDSIAPEVEDGEAHGEFDPDLPRARPGDILLFNRAKGTNRLVSWFTESKYYHVGISLGENHVVEARLRGVVIRDLLGPDGDKRFEIVPFENVGGQETALAARDWALTQLGDGYDVLDALTIVLDKFFGRTTFNFTLPGHWTCGEFVATAFEKADHDLFPDWPANSIVPEDFTRFLP